MAFDEFDYHEEVSKEWELLISDILKIVMML